MAEHHRVHRVAITPTPGTQLQPKPFGREDGEARAGEDLSLLGLPSQLPVRFLALIIH